MRYEGQMYRPPMEAYSYILQVTVGCAHNKCTFCNMFKMKKFRVRSLEEIFEDLQMAKKAYEKVGRVFLADGDALVLGMKKLRAILQEINRLFPDCKGIGIYARAKDIERKSNEDLLELHKMGLDIIYMGFETGDESILESVRKAETTSDMISAAQKVRQTPITLLVTMISGLGGKEKWKDHALRSAEVLNQMQPDVLGLGTLMLSPGLPLFEQMESGEFHILTPKQVVLETQLLVENLELEQCLFSSNHASNYLCFTGTLPQDKQTILGTLEKAANGLIHLNKESSRRL